MEPSGEAAKEHRFSDPGSSSIFTAISTIFGFVDFVTALKEVSDENRIFISLIERVRHDVDEAFRLRRCRKVADHFATFPQERNWIDGTIMDVQRSLNDLGLYVENARIDMDGRVEVKMKNKFEWVLRNQQKLITRQIALSTCHQSLMIAVQAMQGVEMDLKLGGPDNNSPTLLVPGQRGSTGMTDDSHLGPYTRRKRRSFSTRSDLQMNAQEIEIASENLPEPVTIMPVALPAIASTEDNLRPHLSLRGSSGYFPSLPILQQNGKPYPELPGCLPATRSMPDLPLSEEIISGHDGRPPIPRKPIAYIPSSLPVIPRHPSLRTGLSEWIIPWGEVQSEKIVRVASPTSSNAATATSSLDTVSSTEAVVIELAVPDKVTTSEQPRLMTTQQRRRLAHTRRLAAAYDDDED
ncbi:uncharacterized protein BDZ99DRAFT_471789 [Mytilinidion resinicola]|uniref:Uncharacterized protein n=1 Tax=Mytilinidion resinicola TaxID=574789 RepID=A0A6A6Z637_9PEZI|nr:uncharacterized protein BDZ99DRAFT_471789 [Mytilinidion resinicola]KAF2816566.1 hypothetical protein BDZ99DRAFT_471789 [Mytilinidion resinicola]